MYLSKKFSYSFPLQEFAQQYIKEYYPPNKRISVNRKSLMHSEEREKKTDYLSIMLGILVICAVSAGGFQLYCNFQNGRQSAILNSCRSNLKNIGTALEIYGRDNGGQYPHSLPVIVPRYMSSIPTCPGAGRATYSIRVSAQCTDFTIICSGKNHTWYLAPDSPRYDPHNGVVDNYKMTK